MNKIWVENFFYDNPPYALHILIYTKYVAMKSGLFMPTIIYNNSRILLRKIT